MSTSKTILQIYQWPQKLRNTKQIYQHAYREYSDTGPEKSRYDCCVFLLYHRDITTGRAVDPQPSPVSTCRPLACSLSHICAVHCIESPPTITAAHANIMNSSLKWPHMIHTRYMCLPH